MKMAGDRTRPPGTPLERGVSRRLGVPPEAS